MYYYPRRICQFEFRAPTSGPGLLYWASLKKLSLSGNWLTAPLAGALVWNMDAMSVWPKR